MAIDTLNKRANCINFANPFKFMGPTPDGSLASQEDRQFIAYSYLGILASGGGGGFNVAWAINSTVIFNYSGIYS